MLSQCYNRHALLDFRVSAEVSAAPVRGAIFVCSPLDATPVLCARASHSTHLALQQSPSPQRTAGTVGQRRSSSGLLKHLDIGRTGTGTSAQRPSRPSSHVGLLVDARIDPISLIWSAAPGLLTLLLLFSSLLLRIHAKRRRFPNRPAAESLRTPFSDLLMRPACLGSTDHLTALILRIPGLTSTSAAPSPHPCGAHCGHLDTQYAQKLVPTKPDLLRRPFA